MNIEAGQLLLHYRLIEEIGEGGMGVVWKAVDPRIALGAGDLVTVALHQPVERRQPGFDDEVRVLLRGSHGARCASRTASASATLSEFQSSSDP